MKIDKQIRILYLYEVISGLQIVDLVWVLLLLQRGFSLAEAGIAEGVFHLVSMCCEIPSGMVSDLIGRKKSMVLSGLVSSVSALCMIATDAFPVILLAMGLNAVSYNLVSGSREALTYDSLKEAGLEEQYLGVASRQETIYQGLCAATGLISIATVALGWKAAYLLSCLQGLLCAGTAALLWEAGLTGSAGERNHKSKGPAGELRKHFVLSFRFLRKNPDIRRRMITAGGIGAGGYLISMLLQEHLVTVGLPEYLVGIPLFLISVFRAAGAAAGEKTGKKSCEAVVLCGGLLAAAGAVFCGSSFLPAVVLAAGTAQFMDEMTGLRLESENQKETDSRIRATVISVGSMVYSIWMAVLSPLAGMTAKEVSVQATFAGTGILILALTFWYLAGEKKGNGRLHFKKRKCMMKSEEDESLQVFGSSRRKEAEKWKN